jgi:hypothetical protein
MRPLVNVTSGMSVFQWFRFVFGGGFDLELHACGREIEGRLPFWIENTEEPLGELFEQIEINGSCNKEHHPHVDWAMKAGIAPGQPFLVEFKEPKITGGSNYWGEDDTEVDYFCDVVRMLPCDHKKALKSWERAFVRIKAESDLWDRREEHFKRQRLYRKAHWKTDKNWHVRSESHETHLRLLVDNPGDARRYGHVTVLAKGDDQHEHPRGSNPTEDMVKASYRRAYDALIQDFISKYPEEEDLARVLALAEVEYSVWDHLIL